MLKPEREKEIRDNWHGLSAHLDIDELLCEIKRLKTEREDLLSELLSFKRKRAIAEEFIGWLTPCGLVKPGPSLGLIGESARQTLIKMDKV